MAQGTDATPMGPGNMRTRVSSYLPTPVSASSVVHTGCGFYKCQLAVRSWSWWTVELCLRAPSVCLSVHGAAKCNLRKPAAATAAAADGY